jgi:hypothetical protein
VGGHRTIAPAKQFQKGLAVAPGSSPAAGAEVLYWSALWVVYQGSRTQYIPYLFADLFLLKTVLSCFFVTGN